MKTAHLPNPQSVARQRGVAVLVVIVFLGIISLLLYANTKTISLLNQELKLLNAKQQIKYGPSDKH